MKQLFLLISFLCLGTVSVNAQRAGSASYGGYVMAFNEETGNYDVPIPNAQITVSTYIEDFEDPMGRYKLSSTETITSDENGYYSVELVAAIPMDYYFTFECRADGYIPQSRTVRDGEGEYDEVEYYQKVDFNLQDAANEVTIQGTVIDAFTKMPIPDVDIHLYENRHTITDANGCWSLQLPYKDIENSHIGIYANHYHHYDWSLYNSFPSEDNVINFSTELYRNVMLVHLEGTVIDKSTKKPVNDAKISVFEWIETDSGDDSFSKKLVSSTTNSDGFYFCDFLVSINDGDCDGCSQFSYYLRCGNVSSSIGEIYVNYLRSIDIDINNTIGTIVVENGDVSIHAVLDIEGDSRQLSDDAGIVDNINTITNTKATEKHFSVSGVEISPTAKGLHIVNGKKIIVK